MGAETKGSGADSGVEGAGALKEAADAQSWGKAKADQRKRQAVAAA